MQLCTKIIDSVAIAAVAVSAVSKRVSAIGFAAVFQSSRTNVKPCASSCVVQSVAGGGGVVVVGRMVLRNQSASD
eukprot:SAG25_NODE_882_length_4969_cov_14.148049_1_plen_74_part_10